MTTQSSMQADTLVLLFSEKASESYKTFNVKMKNGDVHQFNMAATPKSEQQGGNIILYFHDAVTVATINTADIAFSRGSNEMPKLGQLVLLPKEPTQRYHGDGKKEAPVIKPLNPTHM